MGQFIHNGQKHDSVFDVDAERVARVYAQAGLDAATAGGAQDALVEELNAVRRDVVERDPRIAQLFASEFISEDEKLGMLDRVFSGQVSDTTLNLLKVMARHGRLGMVREVAVVARKLWEQRSGRAHVTLETASALTPELEQEILKSLERVLGADPVVSASVNPELIAGFVVRVGDRVYDASTRTQLEHARHAMVARAVDAIQRHPEQFIDRVAEG